MIKLLSLPKGAKEELNITDDTNFAKGTSQVEPAGEGE
jgi:hypothetical protein